MTSHDDDDRISNPRRTSRTRHAATRSCARAGWTSSSARPSSRRTCAVFIDAARQRGERARPRAPLRPAGPGQDDPRAHHRRVSSRCRSRSRRGRPSRTPAELLGVLSHLEQQPGLVFIDEIHRLPRVARGAHVPGHGLAQVRADRGQGTQRAPLHAQHRAVHAGGRHHARGHDHRPAARPLRRGHAARFLLARRSCARSSSAPPPSSTSRCPTTAPRRSRAARAGHRASRTGSSSARATSPRCRGSAAIDREAADFALGRLRVDQRGLDEMDRRILQHRS